MLQPDCSSTSPCSPTLTPLLRSLHWLPVAASGCQNTLQDTGTGRAVRGSAPSYIQALVKPYTPARALCSASANLATSTLQVGPRYPSKTRLFAILAPKWWNELPNDIRTVETLHTFRPKLKTHLFRLYLGN